MHAVEVTHAVYEPENKSSKDFRQYWGTKAIFAEASNSTESTPPSQKDASVAEFYRKNHTFQTYEWATKMKKKYQTLNMAKMTMWEAIELLNTLVDESGIILFLGFGYLLLAYLNEPVDPDTSLSQLQHLLQTAEAIRHAGQPRWFIAAGLIHDVGKILSVFGEEQWTVVGDTFPVGVAFSKNIIYYNYFKDNPDTYHQTYNTRNGIYTPHCGLFQVQMSYGHDEYLFDVLSQNFPNLPLEMLYIVRYHSFYACHRENDYQHLMNEQDQTMFKWVKEFNQYDLYSKSLDPKDEEILAPFYKELVNEFFPGVMRW